MSYFPHQDDCRQIMASDGSNVTILVTVVAFIQNAARYQEANPSGFVLQYTRSTRVSDGRWRVLIRHSSRQSPPLCCGAFKLCIGGSVTWVDDLPFSAEREEKPTTGAGAREKGVRGRLYPIRCQLHGGREPRTRPAALPGLPPPSPPPPPDDSWQFTGLGSKRLRLGPAGATALAANKPPPAPPAPLSPPFSRFGPCRSSAGGRCHRRGGTPSTR